MDDSALFRNSDRRREARIGAKVDVKFKGAVDAAKALKSFSVNFSAGGLCLRTKTTQAIGDRLQLTIAIDKEVFELEGTVAWVRADVIGLRFVDVSPTDRERLARVALLLAKAHPAVP